MHLQLIRCLHDPANVQQTASKCIQNTRANAGRLLNRVNTLLRYVNFHDYWTIRVAHYVAHLPTD